MIATTAIIPTIISRTWKFFAFSWKGVYELLFDLFNAYKTIAQRNNRVKETFAKNGNCLVALIDELLGTIAQKSSLPQMAMAS